MSKKLEMSKCYAGTLAEYAHAYFIKHGINRVDSMTSHECLSEIVVEWYAIEMQQKHMTRYLQHQVMNAIRYSKKGKELFYYTGRVMNYSGMLGYNKPKIYGLVGTENEEINF